MAENHKETKDTRDTVRSAQRAGDGTVVLCAASAYEKKYFFNKSFDGIPKDIQDQLHIICVLFTEDIGGIILFYPGSASYHLCTVHGGYRGHYPV